MYKKIEESEEQNVSKHCKCNNNCYQWEGVGEVSSFQISSTFDKRTLVASDYILLGPQNGICGSTTVNEYFVLLF